MVPCKRESRPAQTEPVGDRGVRMAARRGTTDRLANAESDLGVDAESLSPGTKLAAVFDARRRSRCVADGDYFATPAGK